MKRRSTQPVDMRVEMTEEIFKIFKVLIVCCAIAEVIDEAQTYFERLRSKLNPFRRPA